MDEQTVDIRDICAILLRNFWLIVGIMAITIGLSVVLIVYLPKQYKSSGVINVNADYYQNPWLGDIVNTVYDASELKSRRQASLQKVLTPKFIDEFGYKFGEYTKGASELEHAKEREKLKSKIEFFSVNANASQIGVKANDRFKAYNMTKYIIDAMLKSLVDERNRELVTNKEAIESTVKELDALIRDANKPSKARSGEKVKQDYEKAKQELDAALLNYTEIHPVVAALRAKVNALQIQYNKYQAQNKTSKTDSSAVFLDDAALRSYQEKRDQFNNKLINMSVVFKTDKAGGSSRYLSVTQIPEVPASPIFPNSKLFLMCGVVAGLVLSGILVMFLELKRGTFVSSYYVMDQLDMPMLGELPYDKNMQQELLLLETVEKRSQKLLLSDNSGNSGKK